MNLQLNLFEQDQIYRRQYRDKLSSGQWTAAESAYRKWLDLSGADHNPRKVTAMLRLFEELNASVRAEELAKIQIRITGNETDFPFREELPYFRQGVSLRITQVVCETDFDFLTEGFHPAQAFMDCGQYPLAEKMLHAALGKIEPQSLIRQLLGYAFYIQGKIEKSEAEFTMSVFLDSRTLNPNYIYPDSYRKKYFYLQDRLRQKHLANSAFPFFLWKNGLSRLNPDDILFSESVYSRIEQKPEYFQDSSERMYYFNLILAGADLIRIKNPRKFEDQRWRALQKQLQLCHPDYFQEYLSVLENFNH